jgi:hypothetical protein
MPADQVGEMIEQASAFCGIMSGTARCVNTKRSLTRSLDQTEEGLAMQATQACPVPGCPDPLRVRWLPVGGYEGIYEINSHGDVRRVGRAACNGRGRGGGARVGRLRKIQPHPAGYWQIQLWRDGYPENFLLHVLVAAAFIGAPPPGRIEVNHKDGVKTNTCYANLEYLTPSGNQLHAWRTGLRGPQPNRRVGERVWTAKLTEADVREIRRLYVPRKYGGPRLAREFGVDHTTIYRILAGETWKEIA